MRSTPAEAREDVVGDAVEVWRRVDGGAVEHDLIVEMRPGRLPGRPDFGDVLCLAHVLPLLDVDLREMAIPGVVPVAVIDVDLVAVTAVVAGLDDRPRRGRADWIAVVDVEIDALMVFGPRIDAP